MAWIANEKKVTLKLMVDKKANKVVFAEARKDYLDFISQIMSSPLSNVAQLLNAKTIVGCIETPKDGTFELGEGGNSDAMNPTITPEDGVTYMVMDNLEVKPMSLSLIKPFLKNFHAFDEKIVQVGSKEAFGILKASFETNTVLTTVFLGKKTVGSKLYMSLTFRKLVLVFLFLAFVGFLVDEQKRKMK